MPTSKRYQRREAAILASSGSSIPVRSRTAKSARQPGIEITPEKAEARTFHERLKHAYAEGGFLVLTVRPSRMRWAEDELLRRFDLKRLSFDNLLFDALREEAKELEVDWAIIEQADGTDPFEPGLEEPAATWRRRPLPESPRPWPSSRTISCSSIRASSPGTT